MLKLFSYCLVTVLPKYYGIIIFFKGHVFLLLVVNWAQILSVPSKLLSRFKYKSRNSGSGYFYQLFQDMFMLSISFV